MKKLIIVNYLCYLVSIFFKFVQSQEDGNITTGDGEMQAMFEKNLIVLPSVPKHLCSIFYNTNLTIASGQRYFPYQIQGAPKISWNYTAEKFHTVVVLGALHKEKAEKGLSKTAKLWYQWIVVNVRENRLEEGTVLQPFLKTDDFEPNATHKVVYTFSVFEQLKKIDLNLEEEKDNWPQILLQKYFTPLSNFIENFVGRYTLACNFFYVIPNKPNGGVLRDTYCQQNQSTRPNYNASQENGNNTSVDDSEWKSIFEKNLIVPHLLPLVPKEICSVFYKPGLIIVSGQPYYPYQIQDVPEISWNHKVGKYYTVVVLGGLQKDEEISKPVESSYQWIVLNVRKNNVQAGTVLQPFSQTDNFVPNATHKVVHAFAVFEQLKKIDLILNEEENSPKMLIQKYFTPLSNFTKTVGGSFLIAGNFFYVMPKFGGALRDSPPVRYANWQRNLMSIMRPDHYVGL